MKVIVIGAVAGGMSCASRLKRLLNNNIELTVYEQTDEVSYGACGLPYYISDHIKDIEDLLAKTPQDFIDSGINLKIKHRVVKVDHIKKQVYVHDLNTNKEFIDSYERLVIASGASPRYYEPINNRFNNVYSVRSLNDGVNLKVLLNDDRVKNVTIIGAGYIGLELVEACHKYGKKITLIEAAPQILSVINEDFSSIILEELKNHEVNVYTSTTIIDIIQSENSITNLILKNEDNIIEINTNLIINCAGIVPNTDFIDGINKASNGAIIVDDLMRTSIDDIFAAGDCSIMKSFITNELQYAPLGSNANKQGRIIADYLGGSKVKPFKLVGSSALRIFNLDVARTGIDEREALSNNINCGINTIIGNSYASYYGNEKLTLRLYYNKDNGIIIGAQAIGAGIVIPRINYYSMAINQEMTVEEMSMQDLCYSPPFSGVWDAALILSNTVK